MSLEQFVEGLGERADRGRFLRRVGVTAMTIAGGFAAWPKGARALDDCTITGNCPPCGSLYAYQCCCLLYAPSNCSCSQPWCWGCCGNCQTGERWACCECYDQNCSYAYLFDYSCSKCQGPS
jgi:hypothetical protein